VVAPVTETIHRPTGVMAMGVATVATVVTVVTEIVVTKTAMTKLTRTVAVPVGH
jgi:hypothetical protein